MPRFCVISVSRFNSMKPHTNEKAPSFLPFLSHVKVLDGGSAVCPEQKQSFPQQKLQFLAPGICNLVLEHDSRTKPLDSFLSAC